MGRKTTTIRVDEELWARFLRYCIKKHKALRHNSEELEKAIQEYLDKYNGT